MVTIMNDFTNIVIGIFTAAFYVCMFALCIKEEKLNTKAIAAAAIAVALTMVLRLFYIPLPTTGRVSLLSSVPIMILAISYGIKPAFFAGIIVGVMCMFIPPVWTTVHPMQLIVEHFMCYSCLALSAVFGSDKKWKILMGSAIGLIIGVAGHVFAGVIFFGQYAGAAGYANAWIYSIVVNVSSQGIENLLAFVVMCCLPIAKIKTLSRGEK